MHTSRTANLWPVFAIIFFFACNKDRDTIPSTDATPILTIEEAKRFFTSKIPSARIDVVASLRTDSSETESGVPVVPDWDNAVSYFDEAKQQSVVETPLLQGSFSHHLINPENSAVDTAAFFHDPPNNRLVIVKDAQGVTDYAIMKIAGTYQYSLTNGALASNTYGQMDSLFAGMVEYVDIDDQTRLSYYVSGGQYYPIDSIRLESLNKGEVQDRWEIVCIRVYTVVPCPCEGHTPEEHCACSTQPRVLVSEHCYEANVVSGGGTGTPPFNPNPQWGSGGSNTTNSTTNQSCYITNVKVFDLNEVRNCNSAYTSNVSLSGASNNWDAVPIVNCDAEIVNCQ